jgi:hypothetical protein
VAKDAFRGFHADFKEFLWLEYRKSTPVAKQEVWPKTLPDRRSRLAGRLRGD